MPRATKAFLREIANNEYTLPKVIISPPCKELGDRRNIKEVPSDEWIPEFVNAVYGNVSIIEVSVCCLRLSRESLRLLSTLVLEKLDLSCVYYDLPSDFKFKSIPSVRCLTWSLSSTQGDLFHPSIEVVRPGTPRPRERLI